MAQVPETEVIRIGDGTTDQFNFTFPYIRSQDVFVEVDGTPVPFTVITSNTVELSEAPADGAEVRIYRNSPGEHLRYEFNLGAPFLPRYVDENNLQLLFVMQEAINDTQGIASEALEATEALDERVDALEEVFDPSVNAALKSDLQNQNDPAKGAAIVGRGAIAVESIAAMKATPARAGQHFSLSDAERGGLFAVKSGTAPVDTGEGFYIPLDNGNYAERVIKSPLRADWFGSNLDLLSSFAQGTVVLGGGAYTAGVGVASNPLLKFEAENAATINNLPIHKAPYPTVISKPAGFPWQPPVLVVEKNGQFVARIDIDQFDKAAKDQNATTLYVDPINGLNTNTGADRDNALLSIHFAIDKANTDGATSLRLVLMSGVWNRVNGWKGVTFNGDISVYCDDGAYITTAEPFGSLTWTDEGAGVWSAVRSATSPKYGAVDLANYGGDGRPLVHERVNDASEVAAVPGSFWFNTATNTIYVRTVDSREPDSDLLVLLETPNGAQRAVGNLFVRNAKFIGGAEGAFKTGDGAESAVFVDSSFACSGDGDGLHAEKTLLVISVRCTGYSNFRDGFNYHDQSGNGMRALEVDCWGWDNGNNKDSGDFNNSNGSSAHEAVVIARINTMGWENRGQNIVDIGDTMVWCVGCKASDSTATVGSNSQADYSFTDNSTVWLDGCEASYTGLALRTLSGTTVNVKNWKGGLNANIFGQLNPYE